MFSESDRSLSIIFYILDEYPNWITKILINDVTFKCSTCVPCTHIVEAVMFTKIHIDTFDYRSVTNCKDFNIGCFGILL